MIRSRAIRESAKGEKCCMMSPACNKRAETVVWAHSNLALHGKGRGIKAHDYNGCYMCSACHEWYDARGGPAKLRQEYFFAGMSRSWEILIRKGIIKIEGSEPEDVASKILPRRTLC